MSEVAARLRYLQDRNNWTVADMAERTGIPKRTLDKYLLRNDASLPGFQALCDLSKGLGVSLDWLVFGADSASEPVALYTERATYEVLMTFIEGLLRMHSEGKKLFDDGDHLLGLTPIELAEDFAWRAGEVAQRLIKEGTTVVDLLTWRAALNERTHEVVRSRHAELFRGAKKPTP